MKQRKEKKQISNKTSISYEQYIFEKEELIFYIIIYAVMVFFTAYIFYQSFLSAFLLSPCIYFLLKKRQKKLCEERQKKLALEFREMIMTVSANLKAGYSIENAFIQSYEDMVMLFGEEGLITKELQFIIKGIHNNRILEELLFDFAQRSALQDVKDFAEIFQIGKRSGGDMNAMIRNTAGAISDKMLVRREIETMIQSKKFEQKIMNIIPFGIILYINMTSPGFFAPLYHNIKGNLVMTVCLMIYVAAVLLSERMMKIEV